MWNLVSPVVTSLPLSFGPKGFKLKRSGREYYHFRWERFVLAQFEDLTGLLDYLQPYMVWSGRNSTASRRMNVTTDSCECDVILSNKMGMDRLGFCVPEANDDINYQIGCKFPILGSCGIKTWWQLAEIKPFNTTFVDNRMGWFRSYLAIVLEAITELFQAVFSTLFTPSSKEAIVYGILSGAIFGSLTRNQQLSVYVAISVGTLRLFSGRD